MMMMMKIGVLMVVLMDKGWKRGMERRSDLDVISKAKHDKHKMLTAGGSST